MCAIWMCLREFMTDLCRAHRPYCVSCDARFQHQSITVEEELKGSFLDYSMSVIISRALPDVRDEPAEPAPHSVRDA